MQHRHKKPTPTQKLIDQLSYGTMIACSWLLCGVFAILAIVCLVFGQTNHTGLFYAGACFGTAVALCPGLDTPIWARLGLGTTCLVLLSATAN